MEITIRSNTYNIDKLHPLNQFHVARRLSPVLFTMAKKMAADESGSVVDAMMGAIEPAVQLLAGMPNDESEFIIYTCLSVVKRKQVVGSTVTWSNILINGKQFAFEDIDMPVMMQLVFACVKDNLGNFFAALPALPSVTEEAK